MLAAALLLLPACGGQNADADAAAAEASTAFAAGDHQTARRAIGRALSARDDVAQDWLTLGRTEVALGNYGAALDAYTRAHELDRNNPEALQTLADLAILMKQTDEADGYVAQMLALDPRDPRARITKGFVAIERGDHRAALALAEAVIAEDPRYMGAIVLRSRALAGAGDHARADTLLETATRVHGKTEQVLEALLVIRRNAGDRQGIRRSYADLIALNPGNVERQFEFARELYRQDAPAAALDVLERLHRARPDDLAIPGRIANLWLSLDATPAGLAEIRRFAAIGGTPMRVAMARYALDTRWPGEAVRLLKPLVGAQLAPGTHGIAAMYAQALLATGQRAPAAALAERVLASDASSPRALMVRGTVSLDRGRHDAALADALLLTSEGPGVSAHHALLARVHTARGEDNLALQTLKRAQREFPGSVAVLEAFVRFHERRRDPAAAAALLDAFTSRNAGSLEGWQLRAELCRKLDNDACLARSLAASRRIAAGAPDSGAA